MTLEQQHTAQQSTQHLQNDGLQHIHSNHCINKNDVMTNDSIMETYLRPAEERRKIVTVVAAVFRNSKDEILKIQRPKDKPMPGLWEFPGGKIEIGETPEQALIRELDEELGMVPFDLTPLPFASHAYETFHVVVLPFLVTQWQGEIELREKQQGYMWATVTEFMDYDNTGTSVYILDALRKLGL